jgi:hypothetical protein
LRAVVFFAVAFFAVEVVLLVVVFFAVPELWAASIKGVPAMARSSRSRAIRRKKAIVQPIGKGFTNREQSVANPVSVFSTD